MNLNLKRTEASDALQLILTLTPRSGIDCVFCRVLKERPGRLVEWHGSEDGTSFWAEFVLPDNAVCEFLVEQLEAESVIEDRARLHRLVEHLEIELDSAIGDGDRVVG